LCLWKLEKVNSILWANPVFSGIKTPWGCIFDLV